MNNKYKILTALLLIASLGFSQEGPVERQYLFNKFLINPAIAGYNECDEIRITHRQQWMGFNKGPMTPVASYHARIWQGLGLGGYAYGDRNGLTNQAGGQLAAAYHISFAKARVVMNQLSFGLAMNYSYRWINTGAFTDDVLDPTAVATEAVPSTGIMIPNVSAGIYYQNKNFFIGASALNLMKSVVGLGEAKNSASASEPYLPMRYYLNTGYFKSVSTAWGVEPSLMVKLNQNMQKQVDVNCRIFYQTTTDEYVFFGISLRSNLDAFSLHTIMPMAGMRKNDLFLGLAYDAGLYTLQKYNYGAFEVLFGWNFCRAKKIERAPCPAFKDKRLYK